MKRAIECLHMTAPDAHHYITRQAMEQRTGKREIAESIVRTYQQHQRRDGFVLACAASVCMVCFIMTGIDAAIRRLEKRKKPNMKSIETDGRLICYPTGRIDSTNAAAFEQELTRAQAEHPGLALVLDAEGLDYLSSAGLRILLRQRQTAGELTIRKQNCRRILGMEVEQALYIRENLLPLYFGETGEALARKRTVIDAMRRVRLLLICFLQGWDHMPSDFDDILADARANVFSRLDELCALIGSEF